MIHITNFNQDNKKTKFIESKAISKMSKTCKIILLVIFLVINVNSVAPSFLPSDKYVRTGVFQITSSAYATSSISNTFKVSFSGCVMSSSAYKVGFGLYSLDIKFNSLKIQFDIQTSSTSTTGFELIFSSGMGDLISLLKVCYIVKQPSYSDIFYIETYRFTGPSFTLDKNTPISQQYALTTSLPISAIPAMSERTFLHAFDVESTVTGVDNNIDIYPSTYFLTQTTLQLVLNTLYDDVVINFFSFTVVFYWDNQINTAGLSQFTLAEKGDNVADSNLLYDSTPLQMLSTSTYVGLKAFHVRTGLTPNYLNFQTVFVNDTYVKFPSTNNVNWKYMKFQILIIYAKVCPSANPYYLTYLSDCVSTVPAGYTILCDNTLVADLDLRLEYVSKQSDTNKIEISFALYPNDISFNSVYNQVDWSKALSLSIPNSSQTIEYIYSPYPRIKILVDYTEDLQQQDKSFTLSAYDSTIYPVNLTGLSLKTYSIRLSSTNNLAIRYYTNQTYTMAKALSYIAIILSALYLLFFVIGLVAGKLYILQMALVPQVTFISLACLDNISPTMASLSFLKYVFGYSYSEVSRDVSTSVQNENYLSFIGVSPYFIFNYNVMLVFTITSFIALLALYLKFRKQKQLEEGQQSWKLTRSSVKMKRFFSLDTPLYLTLWFSLWVIFAGEMQIRTIAKYSKDSALTFSGLTIFIINILLFSLYFFLYFKKYNLIATFHRYFSHSFHHQTNTKIQRFYLVFFIERLVIATILANTMNVKFIHCIIFSLNLVIIVLIAVFKPYKVRNKYIQPEKKTSQLKPNIRQILNYSILFIIQILFFITNYIQSSQFALYVPLIILILLLLNLILTAYFLIADGALKKDFEQFKKIFADEKTINLNEKTQQSPIKTDPSQIEIRVFGTIQQSPQQNSMLEDSLKMNKKHQQQRILQSAKRATNQKKQSNSLEKKNLLRPQQNLPIDQMLAMIAQNNRQIYTKNKQQIKNTNNQNKDQSFNLVRHRQIMKDSSHKNISSKGFQKDNFFSYWNTNKPSKFDQMLKRSEI